MWIRSALTRRSSRSPAVRMRPYSTSLQQQTEVTAASSEGCLEEERYHSASMRSSRPGGDPYILVSPLRPPWVTWGVLQHSQQRFRLACHLHFPNDLAHLIHNADAGLLDRNVRSSKMAHAALLLLVLEPFTLTSFHHQPEAQHPKSSAIHKLVGRLPHLCLR